MIDFILNVVWLALLPIIMVYLAIEFIRDTRKRAAHEKGNEVTFESNLRDYASSLPVEKEEGN